MCMVSAVLGCNNEVARLLAGNRKVSSKHNSGIAPSLLCGDAGVILAETLFLAAYDGTNT